jgi:hypothetical protein
MSEQKLYRNLMLLGAGVEACIEKKLSAPALILIYSGIDTAGWIDSDQSFTTRSSFINWVDRYLLQARPLACTAVDLYAARCGLLHTLTPDSQLSSQGRARRICYAWGQARVADIQRVIDTSNKNSEYVAVHVEELYEAWRLGLLAFTQEIENDPARSSRVYAKAKQFFSEWDAESVKSLRDDIDRT